MWSEWYAVICNVEDLGIYYWVCGYDDHVMYSGTLVYCHVVIMVTLA